jgi:glycyl-tRNA synthetase beta chain
MSHSDLLLEIGCEEIPAKMLARQLIELPAAVEAKLAAARLGHGGVRALGTPRRLAIIVTGLAERQPDLREDVVGPPVSAAFAADGALTKAGQGFAAKNGVAPEAITRREIAGKKGEYAVAVREVIGQPTRALLSQMLAEICAAIAWPKSMRWGWTETTFVRPVQWLVALFGGEVVPFAWAGQTAGRASRGHRFLAPGHIEIPAAANYVDSLRGAKVVVDPAERRATVELELARVARETGTPGMRVRNDDALIAEVIHLGELPTAIAGTFDPAFLEVPEEMIVTSMRTHQRYFALEDAAGKLANRFVTIAATQVRDATVVARGNETVLASRLSDARFFFGEDKKRSFTDWNAKLDHVVFQQKLGDRAKTTGDKLRRLVKIVTARGGSADAIRAAELCKADLASHAVGEFPELQGTMGKHYARVHGETPAVADAIEQHWWPKGQGAALPVSDEAALVAVADRMDTLVGCFATGLVPSGNADPLGLRRAAIGVLQILLDRGPGGAHEVAGAMWNTSPYAWGQSVTAAYGDTLAIAPASLHALRDFMRTRLKGILVDDEGIDALAVDAALAIDGHDTPCDVRIRAKAMSVISADARAVFKRIGNILDDARGKGFGTQREVAEGALAEPAEQALWSAYRARHDAIVTALEQNRYSDAIDQLGQLGSVLAAFFDKGGVMVMAPDATLRENRLALLGQIYDRFAVKVGDFRKLGGSPQ